MTTVRMSAQLGAADDGAAVVREGGEVDLGQPNPLSEPELDGLGDGMHRGTDTMTV